MSRPLNFSCRSQSSQHHSKICRLRPGQHFAPHAGDHSSPPGLGNPVKHGPKRPDTLNGTTPSNFNALDETDVVLNVGEHQRAFTCAGFRMTFSVPNLQFHATTAYDLLRAQGVPLGKGDYLGRIKLKG